MDIQIETVGMKPVGLHEVKWMVIGWAMWRRNVCKVLETAGPRRLG